MSNRIHKQRKSSSIFKEAFLSKIIVQSKEISIYKNYFKCDFCSYAVSPLDSSQYIEYIRSNCFGYNVLNFIITQLETLSSIYICLETELKNALEKQI